VLLQKGDDQVTDKGWDLSRVRKAAKVRNSPNGLTGAWLWAADRQRSQSEFELRVGENEQVIHSVILSKYRQLCVVNQPRRDRGFIVGAGRFCHV
jgi:hypothetical protein